MTVNLRTFASFNSAVIDQLWDKGYRTSGDVLEKLAEDEERAKVASDLGIEEQVLQDLVCRADLARVKGIGNLYALLLQHAQIHCAEDLAKQEIEDLYNKMLELNREHRITRRVPKLEHVENWVMVARSLEPKVEH